MHKMTDIGGQALAGNGTQQGAFQTTLQSLYDTLKNFTSVEKPYSVKADEDGKTMGDFLVNNATLAVVVEEKRKALKKAMLSMKSKTSDPPEVYVTYFQNWSKSIEESKGLMLIAKPQTAEQVSMLVKGAKKCDIKIGCGGSYHTWSPLFPDKSTKKQVSLLINNYFLVLDPESKERIRFNKDKTEVTITTGVTTGELQEQFLEHRVSFLSNVVSTDFTYGGVLTTGCHGTGKDQQIMSDWITSMKLVDHTGTLHTYPDDLPKDVNKDDAMNALRVSLGVFGVVIEVTMKVVPMPTAVVNTMYPSIGGLLYGTNPQLKELIQNHFSVEFMWFPFNSLDIPSALLESMPKIDIWEPKADEVWMRAIDTSDEYCVTSKMKQLEQKFSDSLSTRIVDIVGHTLFGSYPSLIPAYLTTGFQSIKMGNKPGIKKQEMPYAIHFRYGISNAPCYNIEFAFPFSFDEGDESFDNVLKAIRFAVEEVYRYAQGTNANYPLTTTLDFRVIGRSDCLLCTASKDGNKKYTAYVEVACFSGTTDYQDFFKKIGEYWMKLGGVPHWAKQWTYLPNVFPYIREHYGDNLTKFKSILKALSSDGTKKKAKLNKIFINSTMERLLEV